MSFTSIGRACPPSSLNPEVGNALFYLSNPRKFKKKKEEAQAVAAAKTLR